MAVVGPGAQVTETVEPGSLLDGASEYEYVTVLNPLTDDFMVLVAQDIPVSIPFQIRKDASGKTSFLTSDEKDARQIYGLNLKNPEHQAKKYIANKTVIPAGTTVNFRGNEAQVVVRQLVNELLQREGNKRLLADPNVRRQAEQRIIQHRGNIQELMDGQMITPQAQALNAVNRSNEVINEPFPGLKQATGVPGTGGNYTPSSDNAPDKRAPGRPKKVEQPTDQV